MKIVLEPIDNGILKTVIDDNVDGAGKYMEKKSFFILDDNVLHTEAFLNSFIKELGLFTGNPADKEVLKVEKSFGSNYYLTTIEAQEARKKLTTELNRLKRLSVVKNMIGENEDFNN